MQTLVGGQDLVGDGGPTTTPGRVNYFRAEDGTTEAVFVSPRRKNADGTTTVWEYNQGPSVANNPGAEQVTSVQQVTSPEFARGTTTRAVQIRTEEYTQPLAGGGAGADPGSVTYRPVQGNPRLQDVVVEPSVTETGNADGSTTIVYSALVPAGRELNASGTSERFRVAVGTPMRQVQQSVFIPAPAPEPAFQPEQAGEPSPAFSEDPGYDRRRGRTAGDAASSPERALNRNPAASPAPTAQPQQPGLRIPDWVGPAAGAAAGAAGALWEGIRFLGNPLGVPQSSLPVDGEVPDYAGRVAEADPDVPPGSVPREQRVALAEAGDAR